MLSLSCVKWTQIQTLLFTFGTTTIPAHHSAGSLTRITPNCTILSISPFICFMRRIATRCLTVDCQSKGYCCLPWKATLKYHTGNSLEWAILLLINFIPGHHFQWVILGHHFQWGGDISTYSILRYAMIHSTVVGIKVAKLTVLLLMKGLDNDHHTYPITTSLPHHKHLLTLREY